MNESLHILITGATGFVGSALASEFLSRGHRVTALSRSDPDGWRTRKAIEGARVGFGKAKLTDRDLNLLEVIQVEPAQPGGLPSAFPLQTVTHVWHVAAEMSYALHNVRDSFRTNVVNTTDLYETCLKRCSAMKRFYYVSTAYVAGQPGRNVLEEVHTAPMVSNSYQISKWGAEHALCLAQNRMGMPVSVVRPTIVVGHRSTGWTRRNGFGFYMFLEGLMHSGASDSTLNMDLLEGPRPDLIPIDDITEDAVALTERPEDQHEPFEVFHLSGGLGLTTGELIGIWAGATGVGARPGVPTTSLERRLDRLIAPNKLFARTEWHFDRSHLDHRTGRSTPRAMLTHAEMVFLCERYVQGARAEMTATQRQASREIRKGPSANEVAADGRSRNTTTAPEELAAR